MFTLPNTLRQILRFLTLRFHVGFQKKLLLEPELFLLPQMGFEKKTSSNCQPRIKGRGKIVKSKQVQQVGARRFSRTPPDCIPHQRQMRL